MLITYFSLWFGYFLFFWSGAITIDHSGNVVANHVNIWGDWAAHFTMGSRMAFDQLITKESPLVMGHSFSYPFAADLISAVLIRAGFTFFNAFIFPSFLFSILVIWALYYFYHTIFKSHSTAIAASSLFLFNGGLGFAYYLQDLAHSNNLLQTLINPPQQYTNIEPLFYRWISVIDSMIIPQRAFGLGFPLTLIALTMCFSFFFKTKTHKQKPIKLLIPIILLGLMPIIHTHSFLCAFIILSIWAGGDILLRKSKKQIKNWLLVVIGVGVISIPIINFFFLSQVSHDFIKWFPGWYSYQYPEENWIWFWVKNWGFVPLLAALGLWHCTKNQKKKNNKYQSLILFSPFFIIFILANLFLFQPFIWDNTKLVVWASVGFSGLAAYFLVFMWRKKTQYILFARSLIIILFLVSIFSGTIDAYRAIRFKLHSHIMYSQEEMSLTNWVKSTTNPASIWLTGDNHNHWLYNLTGRQTLMVYRGWLWTHGYKTGELERDVSMMFKSPTQSQNLFKKYQVDYIVIGPNEKRVWQADPTNFNHLKLIKASANYMIYSLID